MPLLRSGTRDAISANIREMLASGHSHAQSVAAALHTADRYGRRRAAGGSSGLPTNLPAGYGGSGAPANPNAASPQVGQPPVNPNTSAITSAFQNDLGRAPTAADLTYYNGQVAAGSPLSAQINSIAASPDAKVYGANRGNAPTAPAYQVPSGSNQGILSSGLMNVPQIGDYTMDLNTGALSPHTQQMLQSYAMRGLPPPGGYPQPAAPAPAANATTNPNPDPNTTAYITALQSAGADPNLIQHAKDAQNTPYYGQYGSGGGGGMKRGGALANGGAPSSAEMAPWYAKSEAHAMDHPSGLVHNFGPGRTDTVPMSVASGSHVVPSDIIAGLGQGNTLAGAHAMSVAMKTGPGGISLPSGPHKPMALPRMPSMTHMARGGDPHFEGHPIKIAKGNVPEHQGGVRCIVAGGEFIFGPDDVRRVLPYKGKTGHQAIDQWILDRRAKDVKKIKSLPPPVKS